jgi:hypothetical protein
MNDEETEILRAILAELRMMNRKLDNMTGQLEQVANR